MKQESESRTDALLLLDFHTKVVAGHGSAGERAAERAQRPDDLRQLGLEITVRQRFGRRLWA